MTTPVSGKLAGWTVNSPPPREEADYAGSLFAGRYRLHRQIGNGGMSTIHEAHDATLGTRVAIKIMRGDLPSDPVDRFRREAHVLAALSHEHIARIIDRQDPEEGPRFLVTEYIDGLDIGVLRRRGPLPAAVVLQIGLQVSAALAQVHAAGVIHRDIKPSNMMLVRHSGGDIFVKVIDFGLAKLERGSDLAAPGNAPPGARRATRGDAVHGTVPYWCGEEGPRRDIYALALTLAELLTGEAPDVNANLAREAVPPALARAIKAALSSDGSTTMDHFHGALREVQDAIPVRVSEAMRRAYIGRALTDPPAPEPGEAPRFAERYIVCSELGEGGMGRVQLVFDTEHQRQVALKTIQPRYAGNKNLEARFRREGRALAAIEHIGVPTLLEGGLTPRPYFTMEIVTGVSLAAALKDGRMEPARALSLAIELGKILCAAHEVGVIHRDVKPDNIILGHGDRVHLLDFGACLLMPRFHQRNVMFPGTPPDERYNTGDYELVGTPGYTAPEVMSQEFGAGPRSDVYSVCVVLYEMLTGWPLIDGTTYTERKVVRGNFPASLGAVVDLLRGGTSREPSDRPRSMTDLVGALEVARTNLLHARERRRSGFLVGATLAATATITALLMPRPEPVLEPIQAVQPQRDVTSPPHAPETPAATPPLRPEARPPPPEITEVAVPPSAAPAPPIPTLQPTPTPPPERQDLAAPTPSRPASKQPVALTEAIVRARLSTRHDVLQKCRPSMLVLDLAVAQGAGTLIKLNGMPFAEDNPTHRCVRDALHGLKFPRAKITDHFAVTLDLRQPSPPDP